MPVQPVVHANALNPDRFMEVASPIIETFRAAEEGDDEAAAIVEAIYGYSHSLALMLGDYDTVMRLRKETERMRLGHTAEQLVKRATQTFEAAAA
jgi:hypothetical protein